MVEVISNQQSLAPLKEQWNALANLQQSPLLAFDWFVSCIETIHAADPLRIVVVREGDKLYAIAPLCVVQKKGIATLELIGTAILYEPSGFLYADQPSLQRLLDGIIQLGLPLDLLRLPDNPLLHACLRKLAWRKAILLVRQSAPSAFLQLPADWEIFLATLSSNRRYDFRRKQKCLEKAGQVTSRIITPTLAEFPALLQAALVVEDKSWKGQRGSSLLKNTTLLAFFERYTRKACEAGSLRLCFIELDGKPISMHIAIASHGSFWVLKLGFDEAFSKCSPGAQLAMDTIEYSVRQGLSGYEFLGSAESWQQAWPIEEHACFTALLYPYSFAGLGGLSAFLLFYSKKLLTRWLAFVRSYFLGKFSAKNETK